MSKTTSKSKQSYYSNYKSSNKWSANRKKKLLKQAKLQPNNRNITNAIADLSSRNYRRKTPKNSTWSSSRITIAKLFKEFMGHVPKDLFHANPKIQAAALAETSRRQYNDMPKGIVSFKLGDRL